MNRVIGIIGCIILSPILMEGQTLHDALSWSRQELQSAREELERGRDKIVQEKLPLVRDLRKLKETLQARKEALRLLESREETTDFDLQRLRREDRESADLAQHLDNQVKGFRQEFESSLAPGERNNYADTLLGLDAAHYAEEENLLDRVEVQFGFLEQSLDRLESLLGGSSYETEGIAESGAVERGSAVAYGPIVFFKSHNGVAAGNLLFSASSSLAEIQSLDAGHKASVDNLFDEGESVIRVDPTLGQATLISDDRVTFTEQLKQGGPWMIPIGLFGTIAFLASIIKWIRIRMVSIPSLSEFERLQRNPPAEWDKQYGGYSKPLLEKMVAAMGQPNKFGGAELDVAYQEFRFLLNRWLPVIALTAAVSPLLGLLGTVTGMIKTFELISLFGMGDARLLSGGISEALITTKFGLVVAIPALVLHAYLQRRTKKILIQAAGLLEQIVSRPSP